MGSSRKTVFARSGEPAGGPPPADTGQMVAMFVMLMAIPLSFMVALHFTGWGARYFWRRLAVILIGSFLMYVVWVLASVAVLFFLEWLGAIP